MYATASTTQALERAHGGHWLPQELRARRDGLHCGQTSLTQQLERLTDAYLAGIVRLEEYGRRRTDLEHRLEALGEQQKQLEAQVDRGHELAGLSSSIEDFCARVRRGLDQARFDQKRQLIELLIDRIIVTEGEVQIRYVWPTARRSEQIRFCHLRLDYRAGSQSRKAAGQSDAELPGISLGVKNDSGH
jgi:site-specific DNA recombinase